MPKPTPAAQTGTPSVAPAVPNYEVKVFLDPARVLDIEFKPARAVGRVLGLKNSNRKIAMLFLDGRPTQLDPEGWNVRVRAFEGEDDCELGFKRRYRVPEGGNVTESLAAAVGDGFHAGDVNYAAQVEWGFGRQTLSFTRKKPLKVQARRGMELPPVESGREAALLELPGKLDRHKSAGWARGILAAAHGFGPVLGRRWAGDWQGPPLSFEVWLPRAATGTGFEPVVELSFKADKQADAGGFRDKLIEFVRDQGWLVESDVLKTKLILERY